MEARRLIGFLRGRAIFVEDGRCVIDTGGVGYVVQASTATLSGLAGEASLLIETVVREDAILLFGFADAAERDWFRALVAVQGVGATLALKILSALPPPTLSAAVLAGDRAAVSRAPGVGPKLAVRLLTELASKVGVLPTTGGAAPVLASGPEAEALSALVNLGYRRAEVQPVVARVLARRDGSATMDVLIRDSLRELAPPA